MTTMAQVSETQAQKAATVNENFDAVSPAGMFGRKASTSVGLTWGYYGGRIDVDGVSTVIADGTLSLTGSTTNYIEATRAGVVSFNTSAFTPGRIPLFTATTSGSAVTSYVDYRYPPSKKAGAQVSVAVTSGDVTLTYEQARVDVLKTTGVLTGNRAVIVPAVPWAWIVDNSNTGAFTTTVKTASGSGVAVPQGTIQVLYCDGTDVKAAVTSFSGTLTAGGAIVSNLSTYDLFTAYSGSLGSSSTYAFANHYEGTGPLGYLFSRFSASAGSAQSFSFVRGRGTAASGAIVQSGDTLGHIFFVGTASASATANAAKIEGIVDGTPGASNDMPGALQFYTTPDGSGTMVNRVKIGNQGNVILNNSGNALATNATGGFTYLPTCAGTPTGVPAVLPTGAAPVVIDSTNNKFYFYSGGAWRDAGP